MSQIEELADRVERLLLRHEEVQRTNVLLREQLAAVAHERDNLRSRLNAARSSHRRAARSPAARRRGRRPRQTPPPMRRHRPAERRLKQVEVTILGQSYLLGCPDGGEKALLEAVAAVDREMSAIRDGGKVKAARAHRGARGAHLAFALAERAEHAEPPAATARAPAEDESAHDATSLPVDVAQLIKRIDMALGADGQLL
jgi:cell division protein ZapA